MTMRLRLHGMGIEPLAFGCSPAQEALRSLHVLTDVKHHPLHISWALRTRSRMTSQLKDDADTFAFWYLDRPLVFRELWPQANVGSWVDELSVLREAPIEQFAEQLIHGALTRNGLGPRVPLGRFLRSPELQEQALAQIQARHPASLPAMHQLIADPEHSRERFAQFLSAYWQACIGPDWPTMAARLRADIARRGRAISRRGLLRMLEELSPHVRVDHSTDEVVIPRPGRRAGADQLDLTLTDHDQLLLVPSHFVWPELTAVAQTDPQDGREQQTVLIVYALAEMQREGRAPVPPQALLKLLRSAGDPTRLQVLQLLTQQPRSTREIAGLIGLTEAAISKQLKLLQDAGWVTPERRSYYVYYRLVRESLTDLSEGLEQMLG
jgi:DNA-binding transcriptional ArsR family regulator